MVSKVETRCIPALAEFLDDDDDVDDAYLFELVVTEPELVLLVGCTTLRAYLARVFQVLQRGTWPDKMTLIVGTNVYRFTTGAQRCAVSMGASAMLGLGLDD